MNRLIQIFLIVTFSFTSCKDTQSEKELVFPDSMAQKIPLVATGNFVIIYYHPGDCSMCYGTQLKVSEIYPEIPLVSITSVKNKNLIDYYMEQIKFKGVSIIDSDSSFYRINEDVLNYGNLLLINAQNKILLNRAEYDQDLQDEITRLIK